MKYRKGFVTNSSSSSFICEVCGDVEVGYDMGIDEAGMVECENGHIFCKSHLIKPTQKEKFAYLNKKSPKSTTLIRQNLTDKVLDNLIKEVIPLRDEKQRNMDIDSLDELDFDDYEYPSCFCPICNLNVLPDYMKIKYLLKEAAKTDKMLLDEINTNFKDYDELQKYLNK